MTLVIWWLVLGPCRSFAQSLQCCRCQFVLLLSKAWMMFGKEIRYLPRKMLCNMMVQTKLDSPGTEIQREKAHRYAHIGDGLCWSCCRFSTGWTVAPLRTYHYSYLLSYLVPDIDHVVNWRTKPDCTYAGHWLCPKHSEAQCLQCFDSQRVFHFWNSDDAKVPLTSCKTTKKWYDS